MIIRPLAEADLHAVHAIDVEAYATPWSIDMLRTEIERDDRCHFVAIVGDGSGAQIAGHGSMFHVAGEATLSTIAVVRQAQGRAIATNVLLALFDDAVGRGTTDITLEVRAANRRAQRLYHRFGFAPEGIRPAYYANPVSGEAEDAVLMWARDIGATEQLDRRARIRSALAHAPAAKATITEQTGVRT